MSEDHWRERTRFHARRAGIDPAAFERQIVQESGYAADVIDCRRASSAGAQGIAQIVPRWHPGVNPCDPEEALAYAADLMAGYVRAYGSYRKALAAYNWGSGNVSTWDGRRESLPAETRQYLDVILGPGWPEPSAVAAGPVYDPTYPAFAQNDDWSCAPTSTRWAMHAYGRRPTEAWIEGAMLAQGVVSVEQGLLDASGAGLADFIRREYREFGYDAQHAGLVSFDEVRAVAGASPVLIGGRRWGEGGHWSGVRGYEPGSDRLMLANPAPGYGGVQQTMSRQQFDAVAPCSLVLVTHASAGTVPAPVPAADPKDAVIADLRRQLDEERTKLGVLQAQYVPTLNDVAKAISGLRPGP